MNSTTDLISAIQNKLDDMLAVATERTDNSNDTWVIAQRAAIEDARDALYAIVYEFQAKEESKTLEVESHVVATLPVGRWG